MSINAIVVDDDRIFVMLLRKLLAREPFYQEPKDFGNGQLAIDFLKPKYSPSSQFIIFLDINMPIMNGWEFLESIQEFADPKNTFVFIVTSSINESDIQAAANNHFVLDYLTKPILAPTLQLVKEKIAAKL